MMAVFGWLTLCLALSIITLYVVIGLRYGGKDLGPARPIVWILSIAGFGCLWKILINIAPFTVAIN